MVCLEATRVVVDGRGRDRAGLILMTRRVDGSWLRR